MTPAERLDAAFAASRSAAGALQQAWEVENFLAAALDSAQRYRREKQQEFDAARTTYVAVVADLEDGGLSPASEEGETT